MRSKLRPGRKQRVKRSRIASLETDLGSLVELKREVRVAEKSTQVYVLAFHSKANSTGGGISMRGAAAVDGRVYRNVVRVFVNTNQGMSRERVTATLTHEFTHVGQYEKRKTTLSTNLNSKYSAYDYADEIEAYRRQLVMGDVRYPNGQLVNHRNEIDSDFVASHSYATKLNGTSNIQSVITARQMESIRRHNKAILKRAGGGISSEGFIFYKGWRKDF